MRSPICVIALSSLAACSSDALECPEILTPPVMVELSNAETGRRISGAAVEVGDGIVETELMEIARGRYAIWREVSGTNVTASHADYYDAAGTLDVVQSACSQQAAAQIEMERKSPCNQGIAGVRVEMRDETDGSLIAGAEVDLFDGNYSERMIEMSSGLYEGAYDRPGIYAIDATAPGYLKTAAESIWVAEDDCSVLTSSISLTLRRAIR